MRVLSFFLLTALLSPTAASAAPPPGNIDPATWKLATGVAGHMSVESLYAATPGRCGPPPATWRVLKPRVVGHRYDERDPVFEAEERIRSWLGIWLGLLMYSSDPAGGPAGGEPWYRAPVCTGLIDDVDDEGRPAPNAFATSDRNILVGRRMYEAVTAGGFHGDREAGLVYVLAHEFGHYLQFRSGLRFSGPTVRTQELQADCLAGYVMGLTPARVPDRKAFIARTFELAAALGDELVSHPQHHGTATERVTALRTGYLAAGRTIQAAGGAVDGLLQSGRALAACARYPADERRVLTPLRRP